jgi:glutamate-ammonia-ligase adenylyltransferase
LSRATETALLARYGFRTPDRIAKDLPEGWPSDRQWTTVLEALGDTPDPDAGWRRLQRLGDDVLHRVLADPKGARPLLRVVGFSDYLTDLLNRTPGLAGELLGDARAVRTDAGELRDAGFVHIAAADLAQPAQRESFRATTQALTALADDCLRRVLETEEHGPRLAVMAMGKYGAEELNYASDIDVLFVSPDGSNEQTERVAQRVIEVMNGPPVIFRVDADLRPEGRNGPLVRSLEAYRAYYERWAQVWEFQSLIKCRFAVGDDALGRTFVDMIQPYVWPERLSPEAVQQVRVLKARAEAEVTRRGLRRRK